MLRSRIENWELRIEHWSDLLVGPDDVDIANSEVIRSRSSRCGAGGFGGQHVIKLRHIEVGIADHRIIRRSALSFFNVFGPLLVILHRIDAQSDDLDVSLV